MADERTDALYNVVMTVRFRCRGEPQESGSRTTIERSLEDEVQQALSSLIMTSDKVYIQDSLITYVRGKLIRSLLLIPEPIAGIHPSVASSFRKPGQDNVIYEFHETTHSGDRGGAGDVTATGPVDFQDASTD